MPINLLIIHQYLPFKNLITVTFPVENDYVNCILFAYVVIDLARDTSALYFMARCRYHVSAKTKTTPFEVRCHLDKGCTGEQCYPTCI